MTITFTNPTALPLECIRLMGVSAKLNDSPIGYFGTGLKYAIAVLLREKCSVKLIVKDALRAEYTFSVRPTEIRGKEFQLIYMNDELLPFTTALGKNWQLWQAYRELYSNCMDEKGRVHDDSIEEDSSASAYTIIETEGMEEVHSDRAEFLLLNRQPLYKVSGLEVYTTQKEKESAIFYKGIKVLTLGTKYSYNLLNHITLTEDRTAQQWEVEYNITKALSSSDNTAAIDDIININDAKYFESKMDYSKYITPGESFMRRLALARNRSHGAGLYFRHHYPSFVGRITTNTEMSPANRRKAKRLLSSCRFKPDAVFFAPMEDCDYQLQANNIILAERLVGNMKRMRFAYLIACHKLNPANDAKNKSDYAIITDHMLDYFALENAKPPGKKAAIKEVAHQGVASCA